MTKNKKFFAEEKIKNPLIRLIQAQPPSNAESKLPAQSARLCCATSKMELQLRIVLDVITHGTESYFLERVLMDLMLSGGLRVSEVLDMAEFKINYLGQIFIFGSKGSSSKLVTPLFFRKFWYGRIGIYSNPFINISRFSFYKWLISQEISVNHGSNRNLSVTHAFRHLHVYLLELMSIPENDMSDVVGHKSKKSLKYYLNGE